MKAPEKAARGRCTRERCMSEVVDLLAENLLMKMKSVGCEVVVALGTAVAVLVPD